MTAQSVSMSWHLPFKSSQAVSTVAKLETAWATKETVLFTPEDMSELEEGCDLLLGQPTAKGTVAFIQDDAEWKHAVESLFPKCAFQKLDASMKPKHSALTAGAPTPQATPALPALKRQRGKTIVQMDCRQEIHNQFCQDPSQSWQACAKLDCLFGTNRTCSHLLGMDLQPGCRSQKCDQRPFPCRRICGSQATHAKQQTSRPLSVETFDKDIAVQWIDHQDDEDNAAYATPVAKPASQLRVAREGRQLGVRRIASRTSRAWTCAKCRLGISKEWSKSAIWEAGKKHLSVCSKVTMRENRAQLSAKQLSRVTWVICSTIQAETA